MNVKKLFIFSFITLSITPHCFSMEKTLSGEDTPRAGLVWQTRLSMKRTSLEEKRTLPDENAIGFFLPMTTEQFISHRGPNFKYEEKFPEEKSLFHPENVCKSFLGDKQYKLPSGGKLFTAISDNLKELVFFITDNGTVKELRTVPFCPPKNWPPTVKISDNVKIVLEKIRKYPNKKEWVNKVNEKKLDYNDFSSPPSLWYKWKQAEEPGLLNLQLNFTTSSPKLTIIQQLISLHVAKELEKHRWSEQRTTDTLRKIGYLDPKEAYWHWQPCFQDEITEMREELVNKKITKNEEQKNENWDLGIGRCWQVCRRLFSQHKKSYRDF